MPNRRKIFSRLLKRETAAGCLCRGFPGNGSAGTPALAGREVLYSSLPLLFKYIIE